LSLDLSSVRSTVVCLSVLADIIQDVLTSYRNQYIPE
jgi:hypothetical protein